MGQSGRKEAPREARGRVIPTRPLPCPAGADYGQNALSGGVVVPPIRPAATPTFHARARKGGQHASHLLDLRVRLIKSILARLASRFGDLGDLAGVVEGDKFLVSLILAVLVFGVELEADDVARDRAARL